MKKSRIFLAATVLVLAVGGFYGANAMKNRTTEVDYYKDASQNNKCTAITCSLSDLGFGACSSSTLYSDNVCSTQITSARYKPTL